MDSTFTIVFFVALAIAWGYTLYRWTRKLENGRSALEPTMPLDEIPQELEGSTSQTPVESDPVVVPTAPEEEFKLTYPVEPPPAPVGLVFDFGPTTPAEPDAATKKPAKASKPRKSARATVPSKRRSKASPKDKK